MGKLVDPPAEALCEVDPALDQIAERQGLLRVLAQDPTQLGHLVGNQLRRLIRANELHRHLLVFHEHVAGLDYSGVGFMVGHRRILPSLGGGVQP